MTTATAPSPTLTGRGVAVLLIAYIPVNFTFGSVNALADDIGRDIAGAAAAGQIVLSAFTAAFAATLVISGRIGDRGGRRRTLAIGAAAVVVISTATAFATSLAVLVTLRVLLGIAAGLLTPQVLATIQATAEGTTKRTGMMMFAAMSGASTVFGQVVAGGVAATMPDHLAWRVVQVVTGLIALAGLVGLARVPESRSAAPLAMDPAGAAALGAALLAIIVSLTLGPGSDWPVWSVVALAAGIATLVVFWLQQRRMETRGLLPVVPPAVLRIRVVRRGLMMTLLFFTTYGAFLYELSALAQARFGMGAAGASVLVFGFGVAFIATSVVLPRIPAGPRLMTFAGLAQAAILAVIAVLALIGRDDLWSLQWALVPLGVVQAMMFGPVLQTVLSRAPQWATGVASGLFTTMQQVGLSVGVAVLGGVFWGVAGSSTMDIALTVVFIVHALCGLAFATLAHSLR